MAAKFYRKLSPDTKPVLSNGSTVTFKSLDLVVGYFSTDNDYIQSEFARFAVEQKYGITEIPFEEFNNDYLLKKNNPGFQPLKRLSREEMGSGKSALNQISQFKEAQSAAVAVKGTDVPQAKAVPVVAATPVASDLPPQKQAEEFKPQTVKRKQAQKK